MKPVIAAISLLAAAPALAVVPGRNPTAATATVSAKGMEFFNVDNTLAAVINLLARGLSAAPCGNAGR